MRLNPRGAIAVVLLAATAATTVAVAQTPAPFRVGPDVAASPAPATVPDLSRAANPPAVASPAPERGIAAQEPAPVSSADPATGAFPSRGDAGDGQHPFDVNADGRSPATALPTDAPRYQLQPSTTTSPLAGGRVPAQGVPIEAVRADQRRNLTRLLGQSGAEVRELRVTLDNVSEWVEPLVERPIVPDRMLRLDGETDSRAWGVVLSAAEAARGGTLSIAFANSVLVLPEASRLRVTLNGRLIAQTAIDSPDRTKVIALPIPPELLRAGENAVRIEADMRHRIDCSIDATYELWMRIDPRLTGFSFGGARLPLTNLADLGAVGVGTNGATRLRVIQPQPASPASAERMLRAVQSASLRGRYVQPLVEVVESGAGLSATPGVLNIAIGTTEQIRGIVPNLPQGAREAATAELVDAPIGPTVVITGPTERDVDAALARFDAPLSGPGAPQSAIQATPPWLVQNGVRINGPASVTLRAAGVETAEFTGRRFRRSFTVTLPPDFYASAYGEAMLMLDFAYSSDIEQGSTVQVLVNDTLSTAIALTSAGGDTVDDLPVSLGMQAFRPGINTIGIVAELDTEQDRACLPGGSAPASQRFTLFSTSRLVFPRFARIGQLPNLAAFATNGFPYTSQSPADPVRVRIAGTAPDTLGAAGTLMARVAVSRGAPLATEVVEQLAPFDRNGVIVVGALSDLDDQTLEATGAASVIPSSWLQPGPVAVGAPVGLQQYDDQLRRARQQLRPSERQAGPLPTDDPAGATPFPLDETLRSRERWFEEVDEDGGIGAVLSRVWNRLRGAVRGVGLASSADAQDGFGGAPVHSTVTLVLAQGAAPDSDATAWTLVTAPTPGLLSTSMAAIAAPEAWTRIGGRITAFELNGGTVETVPAGAVAYLATAPLSFSNLRLIAANWFSINNGFYALALILFAVVLGFATWALVRPLGRQN